MSDDADNQLPAETSPHDKPWQFRRGNKLGFGNRLAGRVAQFRARLLKQITTADFDAITAKLIDMAKAGDLGAIRKGLDRLFGKPRQERTKHIDRAIRTIAEGERTNLDRKRQRRRRYQLSAGGTGVT